MKKKGEKKYIISETSRKKIERHLCATAVYVVCRFEAERRSLRRETRMQLYSLTAYFVSMSIVWMTIELIMGVAFASSYHIISGLRQGTMFEFIVILVVFMLVNESIGLLCAVVTPSALLAIMLHTPPTVLMMLLGGNNIAGNGSILRYVNYINPYAYGMKYLATAEMNGLVFKGRHHTSGRLWVKTGEEFLGEHLKSEQSFMAAVFSLIGFLLAIRGMAYVLFVVIHDGSRGNNVLGNITSTCSFANTTSTSLVLLIFSFSPFVQRVFIHIDD
mmetsp:Transcript_7642/g.12156  ORF Transcript_7642/g.12156 Transcript_7642/m.12156 type:complete len:274 (-) Transcript_7642:387-1208(-)